MQRSTGVRNAGRTQQALRGAGGVAKMTPAQIAKAERMAGESRPR
jgi:hypothetical protein